MKSVHDFFPKIQLVQKLHAFEREAAISSLIGYVFSSRVSSFEVLSSFAHNSLPLTNPLLGELKQILLHHLRVEAEYNENPEYALTFEYKFQKLSWII